jgi:hypothetical protein
LASQGSTSRRAWKIWAVASRLGRGHHGAAAGLALDQAFVFEPLQYRAHLRPADLEQLSQALFAQTCSGRKAVFGDRGNDARVNYFRWSRPHASRVPIPRQPPLDVLDVKRLRSCVQDAPIVSVAPRNAWHEVRSR